MTTLDKLKVRVRQYLNHGSAERVALKSVLDALVSGLPETVIFGGMLREFALGNARDFTSDIDLVTLESRQEIYRVIAPFSPIENKFGGFRFVVAKRRFDIWAFDDTWAFREGIVRGSGFGDLLRTTFFNLDAAALHLGRKELFWTESYKLGIEKRVLEINLVENPFPERMVRRAIRMALEKDLAIGANLAAFILAHARPDDLDWESQLFFEGLENHVHTRGDRSYTFAPQKSVLAQ